MSKQVIIKRLTICNFKGLRNLTVEFGDDVTTISGRNGTGKTTIKDAFSWLLWGKDSEGNTDSKFGIKTNDANGNFIPDLEHEVSGTFEIIDTETGAVDSVEFRRVLVEEWKVPNGETERVLKGHHTDYFCNGVPLKTKTEYDKRINDIIPEAVFKVITDPYYFLTLHWKAQREMLLQIAGDVSEADVAKDNAEFAALLARVTGKTLEDYKREVAVRKSKISDRLAKIPTAIDAITRVTPVAPDYAALEADKARLEGELTEIDTAISSAAEANRIAYESAAKIQQQINERKTAQQKVFFEAKEAARNHAYKANEAYNNAARDLQALEAQARSMETTYSSDKARIQTRIQQVQRYKDETKSQQDALRESWYKVNAEEFSGDAENLVCPLFNICCKDEEAKAAYNANREAARVKFGEDKEKRLNAINDKGKEYTTQIEQQEAEISRLNGELATLETKHTAETTDTANRRAILNKTLAESPRVSTEPDIKPETLPEWVKLQGEITSLTAQLPTTDTTSASNTAELRQRKESINAQLKGVECSLTVRTTIETNNAEVAKLREEAAKLAQEKADLQNEETLIDDYTTARMNEVERRVNALFSRVQFKMYRTQIEDAKQVPDCVCYIDGVRYADKNTAGKVNAGLDVINTLCAFHGVSAPIFIDNAESVNEFIPVNSQLVKLVVSTEDFTVTNR